MPTKHVSTKQLEVQRITDILSLAIAQHRLKPGQRLIEAQIVNTLKANRNHVQVALQQLALKKIITIEPNRGAMVAKPTAEEAQQVFAARRCIERGIVESITPEIYAANKDRIDAHMIRERTATCEHDRRVVLSALRDFHTLLADICDNQVLKDIFQTLIVRCTLIVSLYQRNDIPSCASGEHQQVLDALAKGDTQSATAIMEAHLVELEQQLVLEDSKEPELNLAEALQELNN